MRKAITCIIKLILAYCTTIALAGLSGYGITGIDIILPCIFALSLLVYHKAGNRLLAPDRSKDINLKKDLISSIIVGLILSAGITAGAHFDIWNQEIAAFVFKDLIYFAFVTVFLGAAALILFGFLDKNKSTDKDLTQKKTAELSLEGKSGIKYFFIITAIILICWLPYYLTLFPGNIGSDTIEELDMCLGRIPWTNHHPVFYTMIINIFVKVTGVSDSHNLAMGLMSAFQMLIFALTLAYIISFIWKKAGYKLDRARICLISLIFFALHPVFPMYAIYLSKDTLFSCALVMLTLSLYELVTGGDKKAYIRIGIWSLFTMLLRNNGLFIVLIVGIILLARYRKEAKYILASIGGAVIIFIAFRNIAYGSLNIAPQSFAESAAIPLQQTGYVIANSDSDKLDGLTDSENEILQTIMPYESVREAYQLGYVDPLKFHEDFNDEYFNEHSDDYMRIWFRLLPGHLGDYIKAYLAQTAGYWHYGETNTLCTQGVTENELGLATADPLAGLTGHSLFGLIEKLMLLVRKAPLLCILTSMAMQFNMLLLLMINYLRTGKRNQLIMLAPVLVLWITIMIATPAFCLFRYTFAIFMLWPVLIDELIG